MNKLQARRSKETARKVLEHANTLVSEMQAMQNHYNLEEITVVSMLSIFEGAVQDCSEIVVNINELVSTIDNNEGAG